VYRPVETNDLDECHGIAQTITFELNGQTLMAQLNNVGLKSLN
jgi:hypothetical protein